MTIAIQQSAKHLRYAWTRQALIATALACSTPAHARAEVCVEGNATAVRISTSQDTIADVLAALGVAFKLRYRTAVPLSAGAGPTYSGSIREVVARLLDGYSYVLKVDRDSTEVIVFGSRSQVAIPSPAPKAAVPPDVISRWQ